MAHETFLRVQYDCEWLDKVLQVKGKALSVLQAERAAHYKE